jgi:hypothetical protein
LAVDALRSLTIQRLFVETAVCSSDPGRSHAEFYAGDYMGDSSNWFVPTVRCLRDWFATSGFTVERTESWPVSNPSRATLVGTPSAATFQTTSYEVPLRMVQASTSA